MHAGVRTARWLALAMVVGLIIPALAQSASTLHGFTRERFEVSVELTETGQPATFRIQPTDIRCERGGELTTRKLTLRGLQQVGPLHYERDLTLRDKLRQHRLRSTIHVEADYFDNGGWGGAYDRTTQVIRKGRTVDSCVLRTYWYAGPK